MQRHADIFAFVKGNQQKWIGLHGSRKRDGETKILMNKDTENLLSALKPDFPNQGQTWLAGQGTLSTMTWF